MSRFEQLSSVLAGLNGSTTSRLTASPDLGDNTGDLLGYTYVPSNLPANAPLVVVLHGCTQTAEGYDHGSGWSALADEQGFALLYPEQQRANNPNLCFNWFRPGDARRGRGEAAAIRQMVTRMVAAHGLDPNRVFITGLSAGGAMTAVMLAAYPEVFAGGAIIAGLPFATANSIPEALDRMRGNAIPDRTDLAHLLAQAAPGHKNWPKLSVWHGTADTTVAIANAEAIVDQWTAVQQLAAKPDRVETLDGQRREIWCGPHGEDRIERVTVKGLGHGTPLATRGDEGLGAAGAHMLEAGINSTRHIARFWGIADQLARKAQPARPEPMALPKPKRIAPPAFARRLPLPRKVAGVAEVIDKALRSAGLLR